MHGVICETTKLATSGFGFCDFVVHNEGHHMGYQYGSFSFNGKKSSGAIKCSQLVQTGF